jgi:flavin-dependent dehydrogenase
MKHDAIIIGSRVAGSSTAMLLAKRGYRVLVVDRATFPSDTISTHIVWQHGVSRLIDWGLGDRLKALDAPALDTLQLDFGPVALTGTLPPVGDATVTYAPRRLRLDKMLVDAAVEAGADVREGFTVDEILFEAGRVTGVRGHDKSGMETTERSPVVIGADGVHSMLARTVQPVEYNVRPTLTCWYYSYWSGIETSIMRFFSRPGRAIGCIPTNDGAVCVGVALPREQFDRVKADIETHYMAALEAAPQFKEEVLSGRREERFYGIGQIPNYFRKPYGPGWALVGDAGYHKDPILAQGISDALRDASLLTSALDDVFDGRAEWDQSLAEYEKTRNRAVEGIYALNAEFATLEPPPPETQALIGALYGNQEDTNRFLGTMTGAVPVEEFYAAENVQRILAAAQDRQRKAVAH